MSYFYVDHVIIIIFFVSLLMGSNAEFQDALPRKLPTVGISVLVRNKAHTLPYFLSSLVEQTYPKDRLYVRFYIDHSSDESMDILKYWEQQFGSEYHEVFIMAEDTSPALYDDELTPANWSAKRHEHVIELREDALNFARKKWVDNVFMVDADVVFTEPDTLKILVDKNLPIVAPMLLSQDTYSNFWCAITHEMTYTRCMDYEYILDRYEEFLGCHEVKVVHTAVLYSLKYERSDKLTYVPSIAEDYYGPAEDIVVFSVNANEMHMHTYVCNTHVFGFVTKPLESTNNVVIERENLLNIKLEAISHGTPLPLKPQMRKYVTYPKPDTLNCSKIFMVNLKRRPERRELMELSFKELGLDVEVFPAVDSKTLNRKDLREMNVKLMPGYQDPYHKRPIKAGEIACMLSHYKIWQTIVEKGYALTMILEDDVRFIPYFRVRFNGMMRELKNHKYDLLYLGRKILLEGVERPITAHTTKPLYSYWTLGYMVTLRGAEKLIAGNPLQNLLPVDEYLPIMFDQHPNTAWKDYFPTRNIKALSASPLLVSPMLYTGMPGYVSDTEDSPIVEMDLRPLRQEL